MKSLGEMAFERYKDAMRGRGAKGKKLGAWSELTDAQREQWERGALKLAETATAIRAHRQ